MMLAEDEDVVNVNLGGEKLILTIEVEMLSILWRREKAAQFINLDLMQIT